MYYHELHSFLVSFYTSVVNLQYFGHLMRRVDSLEKTLMLGEIGGRRRKGWQRMRWHHRLDGHEFEWTPGDGGGQGGLVCCHSWGHKSWTRLSDWTELNWWTASCQASLSTFKYSCLQTRIVEWVATSFCRGSSSPRNQTSVSYVSCISRWVLYYYSHLGSPYMCINTCIHTDLKALF